MTSNQPPPQRLRTGENIALNSVEAGLGGLTIYLDTKLREPETCGVDMSVLLLGADSRVPSQGDFVFYNQPTARDGAVQLRDKLADVKASDGESGWTSNVLTLELDDLSDEIQRILLVASVDDDQGVDLRRVDEIQLRVQRTADAVELVHFDVVPSAGETALLFGELARSEAGWTATAVGRGYSGGLAALVGAHGVDVDGADDAVGRGDVDQPTGPSEEIEVPDEVDTDAASGSECLEQSIGQPVPDRRPSGTPNISMRRVAVAPKLPADWNASIPADNQDDWQPSRLFPVAGVGSGEEQERRATSALLSVMQVVREFGRALTVPMGAPRGALTTFLEVPFSQNGEAYRPDGVIRIVRGQKQWTALVEVKTSSGRLNADQINHYLDIAKSRGFDAVITISNQLTGGDDDHPIAVDRRRLRKVSLFHLSWDQIRANAHLTIQSEKLSDATQVLVLNEFIRYMDHARAGMAGLTDMGSNWVKVRDSVKARTARASDRSVGDVSAKFDELVQKVGFELTGLLGVAVNTLAPRDAPDHSSRRQQLADSGIVRGRLRIPGAIDEIVIGADIRTDRVSATLEVPSPRGDTRPQTRVAWLLRQIPLVAGPTNIRVEALLVGGRKDGPVTTLDIARQDPRSLLPEDQREIRGFAITLDLPMGAKRAAGTGTLIGSVRNVSTAFYGDVVQHLRPWVPKRP